MKYALPLFAALALLVFGIARVPAPVAADAKPAEAKPLADKDIKELVGKFTAADATTETKDESLQKLRSVDAALVAKHAGKLIKEEATRQAALELAVELRLPGLFKDARKFVSGEKGAETGPDVEALVIDLALLSGDKGGPEFVFERWNSQQPDSAAYKHAETGLLKHRVGVDVLDKLAKALVNETRRASAAGILSFQLKLETSDPSDIEKNYPQYKTKFIRRNMPESGGSGGKPGSFTVNDPVDAIYTVPDSKKPMPILVGFHGSGDKEAFFMTYTAKTCGWGKYIAENNMIFLCIGAKDDGPGYTKDQMPGVAQLIYKLQDEYNIDNTRIYSCGFSNGGIWAHYVLWAFDDLFAAGVCGSVACSNEYQPPATGYKAAILIRGDTADPSFGEKGSGSPWHAHKLMEQGGHEAIIEVVPGAGHSWLNLCGGQHAKRCWDFLLAHKHPRP